MQAGVKVSEAKISETHAFLNTLKATSGTVVKSISNLSKTLRELMSEVQNLLSQLNSMNGPYHHRQIRDTKKVAA